MADSAPGFFERNHFLLRRLHSLSGIVPVGVFLIFHLLANSTAFLGAESFDRFVGGIHYVPWLVATEIVFIFAPLAFHGIYGVVIALEGKMNQNQYPYMDNWRYTLQRITAYIAIVFILIHLAHYRFAYLFGGEEFADAYPAFFTFTKAGFQHLWIPLWAWIVIYIIGTAATIYHFCNGLVTFCITWGITVGDASRRKMSLAALAVGVVLMVWGMSSLYALGTRTVAGGAQPGAPNGHVVVVAPEAQH